jgi:hypothetical protein
MLAHTEIKKKINQRIRDDRRVEADKTAYANKRSSKNDTNDNDLLRQNQETSRSNAFKGMTILKYRVKTPKPTAGTSA